MKRIVATFLFCGLMTGCGGGGDDDDSDTTFTYGTPQEATGDDLAAANAAAAGVQAAVSGEMTTDSAEATMGLGSAGMDLLYSGSGYSALAPGLSPTEVIAEARARAAKSYSGLYVDDECPATVTETSVTWDQCTWTDEYDGMTYTVDGSVELVGDNAVEWSVSITVEMSGDGYDASQSVVYSGNIAVTESTVVGSATLALSGSYSDGQQSADLGFKLTSDINLAYSDSCEYSVIDGTLEYKLIWTAVPEGAEDQLKDAGVLFDWSGCGLVTVAYSVE